MKFRRSTMAMRYLLTATALCVALAGCSSGASSDSKDDGGTSSDPAVQAAVKAVAEAQKSPTKIPSSEPLPAAPKKQTYVYIAGTVPQVAAWTRGFKAATAAVGWDLKIIPFDEADPPTLIAALKQALTYDPVGVTVTGTSYEVWKSVIPEYEKAGVPIIPTAIGAKPDTPVVPVAVAPSSEGKANGEIMANWLAADSNGKGHALVMAIPAFQTYKGFSDATTSSIKSACPSCKVTNLNASVEQMLGNGIVPAIVSAVQRDPSIKYVISCDGLWVTGLQSALKAAGRTDVKIAGRLPTETNLVNVSNGAESAWTGQGLAHQAWQIVDIAARIDAKMETPASLGEWPQMLLTKKNLGKPSADPDQPIDYQDQYKALWHVN